ncbi:MULTISPECIES: nitroreductase [unclassified Sphingomonas]|uniref:nitroreductase family protein n=1 Tax=unclassified Sphingomonas TaxID=196159 RepID=UPI000BCC7747|nr:MAG: nitroreductase [Sphingomonas sp. 12-62-6]OYX39370.1 MAG: nitroreductase [Sphingomonas sp. 32-62-10]
MFNDLSTPLSLLTTRRSGRPREMIAPGPDAAQLDAILAIAARTPDHGKINPWRFVIVPDAARSALSTLITTAYLAERPDAARLEIETLEAFATQAPTLVVVLSSPNLERKIPIWEQELSVGAACMNLLHAAHAHGFVGGWLTGWAAYSDVVRDAFGAAPERIAGFIFIGSPARDLEERPRPNPGSVISVWVPPATA